MKQLLSTAQTVRDFVDRNPLVSGALEKEFVNFSALAALVAQSEHLPNRIAVKAALLRYARERAGKRSRLMDAACRLLRQSSFSVIGNIVSIKSDLPLELNALAFSLSPSGYTYLVDAHSLPEKIPGTIQKNLALVLVKSPTAIERVPGTLGFFASALAEAGINSIHVIDCREDTLFAVDDADAPLAFSVLSRLAH